MTAMAVGAALCGGCFESDPQPAAYVTSPSEQKRIATAFDRHITWLIQQRDSRTSSLRSAMRSHETQFNRLEHYRNSKRSAASIANVERLEQQYRTRMERARTLLARRLLEQAMHQSDDLRLAAWVAADKHCRPLEDKVEKLQKREKRLRTAAARAARTAASAKWTIHRLGWAREERFTREIIKIRRKYSREFANASYQLLNARSRWKRTKPTDVERFAKAEVEMMKVQERVYLPARSSR